MNDRQKQALEAQLKSEQKTLKSLREMYDKALKDCAKQIQALSLREEMEPEHLQTIIYQKRYQQMLARQISGVIRALDTQQYDTVLEFLQDSYVNGYAGVMFDIHGQGIPITVPIDQARTHRAITNDTKLSDNLYKSLQGGTARMKKRVQAEVSRGIASGKTWYQISEKLAKGISGMDNPAYYAQRIARTEGHRIQQEAAYTAQQEAKKAGADVVKQWDATLDDRTREDHRILDGTLAEVDEEFTVSGHKALYPGGFGVPSEDIHCRCAILQRARWALDEDELERLRQRAEYYGLDKTDSFQAFKDKYLQLPEEAAEPEKTPVLTKPVQSDDPQYNKMLETLQIDNVEYKPVEGHNRTLTEDEIIDLLAGGDRTRGSCASVALAYVGQKQGWDVRDFRDGISRRKFSMSRNLFSLSNMKGMKALRYGDVKGASSCTLANNFLKTCEAGKEYYLCAGRHASIVRRNDEGRLQYLELQSATKSGWTNFNGNPRYTLTKRFGCSSASGHGEVMDFMLNISDSDMDTDEFRSLLGYLNTAENEQRKGASGTIR